MSRRRRTETQPAKRDVPKIAPEFFVSYAESVTQAESVRASVISFMRSQGFQVIDERPIYGLAYTHDGRHCVDVVGEKDRYDGEPILVILRTSSGPSLVCTANRGVVRGEPILCPQDAYAMYFAE